MAGGGAALSRVSSRGRLAAPYPTVPYSTVPYCVLPYSRNIRQSISYPVSLKESQGERKPLWETGGNVERLWKTCFKAFRPLRDAHVIAEAVHHELERDYPDVKHCTVHVNPA